MILGLSIGQFTALHVGISLIGIAAGLIALPALLAGKWLGRWQAVFLATTLATSLTGFLFPYRGFTPALGFGVISTLLLILAYAALYGWRLQSKAARLTYAVTATLALYLNMFVLVVQSFLKIPALNALAPTGTEPPFAATQALLLIAAIVFGVLLTIRANRQQFVTAPTS